MIHTLRGVAPPRRRIAVIEMPRLGRARLGSISQQGTPNSDIVGYTTISDMVPATADHWQAFILQARSLHHQQTPGTLQYTPHPQGYPPPVTGPWNTWGTSAKCSTPASGSSQPPAAPAATAPDGWLKLVATLTGAAAAVYLISELRKGK